MQIQFAGKRTYQAGDVDKLQLSKPFARFDAIRAALAQALRHASQGDDAQVVRKANDTFEVRWGEDYEAPQSPSEASSVLWDSCRDPLPRNEDPGAGLTYDKPYILNRTDKEEKDPENDRDLNTGFGNDWLGEIRRKDPENDRDLLGRLKGQHKETHGADDGIDPASDGIRPTYGSFGNDLAEQIRSHGKADADAPEDGKTSKDGQEKS